MPGKSKILLLSIAIFAACTPVEPVPVGQIIANNSPTPPATIEPIAPPTVTFSPLPTIPASNTPTATIIPTEPVTKANNPQEGLFYYSIEASEYDFALPRALEPRFNRVSSDEVVFSHYADRIIRLSWDSPRQFWLSDISLNHELDISETMPGSCPYYDWHWTPDDNHIICSPKDRADPGLIYHVEQNLWESWPFRCDRIAISPKTGQLATWCPETGRSDSFAVIEWGGAIWKTSETPSQVFVEYDHQVHRAEQLWSWSEDGKKIAYADANGSLVVVSSEGAQLYSIEAGLESSYRFLWLDKPFEWSADGTKLLILARGSADLPCPTNGTQDSADPYCWRVLDTDSWNVIWTSLELNSLPPDEDTDRMISIQGAISSNGQYVALSWIQDTDRNLWIFDTQSSDGTKYFIAPVLADYLRWGRFYNQFNK